jgi:hypothetical protein
LICLNVACSGLSENLIDYFASEWRFSPVSIHKRILEWQAEHPNITWIGWGIIWAIVLALLLWPEAAQ